jgi:hypothetical protein
MTGANEAWSNRNDLVVGAPLDPAPYHSPLPTHLLPFQSYVKNHSLAIWEQCVTFALLADRPIHLSTRARRGD